MCVYVLHISYHYILMFVYFDETARQNFRCLKHLQEDIVTVGTEQEKPFQSNVYLRMCTLILFIILDLAQKTVCLRIFQLISVVIPPISTTGTARLLTGRAPLVTFSFCLLGFFFLSWKKKKNKGNATSEIIFVHSFSPSLHHLSCHEDKHIYNL